MGEELQDSKNKYWYEDSIPIKNRFYGVLEGGGAKGVAFNGALQAMKENTCWFRSVAGASAGAITAALIASGLSPDKIEEETDEILGKLRQGDGKVSRDFEMKQGIFPQMNYLCLASPGIGQPLVKNSIILLYKINIIRRLSIE